MTDAVANSDVSVPAAGATAVVTAPIPALDDAKLAIELERATDGPGSALIVANAYTVLVLSRPTPTSPWSVIGAGEFGLLSQKLCLRRLKKLTWASVDRDPRMVDLATVAVEIPTAQSIKAWVNKAKLVTGSTGRQGDLNQKQKEELGYLAGWRCQFTGCGQDLRWHAATSKIGQFGYFAHIVASSPDGPRGDPIESAKLASDPKNIILLCDACHRRIDKVEPHAYPTHVLRKMREDNLAEVKRLLDTLRYPEVSTLAVVGNIAGQPAQFSMDDAHEALRGRHLRTLDNKPQRFFDPGGTQHNVHESAYWTLAFQQLRRDLVSLQDFLDGSRHGAARVAVGVFPQHSTSILALAGRVLGDTAGVHIFQPHRNTPPNTSRWAWPEGVAAPDPDKYALEVLREPHDGKRDAILLVELTAAIDFGRLPEDCFQENRLLLPALRITTASPSIHCIRHPVDLELVTKRIDDAVRMLQDQWRMTRVHVFAIAPASAIVALGQKMQARHQAAYVIYESDTRGPQAPFKATIELTSKHVQELVSGNNQQQSLQR